MTLPFPRSLFLGDDTWVSLFPSSWSRAFPFPSFDVKDLDTVDDGVSHHLVPELRAAALWDAGDGDKAPSDGAGGRRGDWQVLVAHFLGVDHAGHRYEANHQATRDKVCGVLELAGRTASARATFLLPLLATGVWDLAAGTHGR